MISYVFIGVKIIKPLLSSKKNIFCFNFTQEKVKKVQKRINKSTIHVKQTKKNVTKPLF